MSMEELYVALFCLVGLALVLGAALFVLWR